MADPASPAVLGFRMPAEWEPHAATWIGWPHNASDWPGKLAAIQWVYGEIVRKLAPGETVRVLVRSGEHERQARRVLERTGVDRAGAEFLRLATNRGWTRDFGPMFVRRAPPPPEGAVKPFRLKAWAQYPHREKDDPGPERGAPRRQPRQVPAARGEPRAGRGDAARGRVEDRGDRSPHAGAAPVRRPAPARELRELLRGERGGARAHVQ